MPRISRVRMNESRQVYSVDRVCYSLSTCELLFACMCVRRGSVWIIEKSTTEQEMLDTGTRARRGGNILVIIYSAHFITYHTFTTIRDLVQHNQCIGINVIGLFIPLSISLF